LAHFALFLLDGSFLALEVCLCVTNLGLECCEVSIGVCDSAFEGLDLFGEVGDIDGGVVNVVDFCSQMLIFLLNGLDYLFCLP
jgi:ethanolamine utilization microcompartment shell protein EutS